MQELFKSYYKNEKNEHTAFVLMLGVISEKQTEIINELKALNKTLTESAKKPSTCECHSYKTGLLSREDYME